MIVLVVPLGVSKRVVYGSSYRESAYERILKIEVMI